MRTKLFFGTGIVVVAGALTTAAWVSSCDEVCALEARPSVIVRFLDSAGGQVTDPVAREVQWWVVEPTSAPPTGAWTDAECADEACTEWIAGFEQEGTIEVRASICGHEYVERIDVPMDADGCHVETQDLDIFIDTSRCQTITQPPACDPLQVRPSVILHVVTPIAVGGTAPMSADSVTARLLPEGHTTSTMVTGQCVDAICSQWSLGVDQAGLFEIEIQACGRTFHQTVVVTGEVGTCHVSTEHTTLLVEPSACTAAAPSPTP